jgi:hypothetical protein
MPRGIPWDDLSLFREKKADVAPIVPREIEIEPRDFNKDAYQIGKRALFGLVVRISAFICIYMCMDIHVSIYVYLYIYVDVYICIHITKYI